MLLKINSIIFLGQLANVGYLRVATKCLALGERRLGARSWSDQPGGRLLSAYYHFSRNK